jgi:hypothetical protein
MACTWFPSIVSSFIPLLYYTWIFDNSKWCLIATNSFILWMYRTYSTLLAIWYWSIHGPSLVVQFVSASWPLLDSWWFELHFQHSTSQLHCIHKYVANFFSNVIQVKHWLCIGWWPMVLKYNLMMNNFLCKCYSYQSLVIYRLVAEV